MLMDWKISSDTTNATFLPWTLAKFKLVNQWLLTHSTNIQLFIIGLITAPVLITLHAVLWLRQPQFLHAGQKFQQFIQ